MFRKSHLLNGSLFTLTLIACTTAPEVGLTEIAQTDQNPPTIQEKPINNKFLQSVSIDAASEIIIHKSEIESTVSLFHADSDPINLTHLDPGLTSPLEKLANLTAPKPTQESIKASLQKSIQDGGWVEVEDGWKHKYSGMECDWYHEMIFKDEETGAETNRVVPLHDIHIYDDKGYDTHCNYQTDDFSVVLTYYASYWPDVTLQDHASGAYYNMTTRFPVEERAPILTINIKIEPDKDGVRSSTIEGDTLSVAFYLKEKNGVRRKTALWINKTGGWHIKERATFAHDDEKAEALAAITYLLTLMRVDAFINIPENKGGVSNAIPEA